MLVEERLQDGASHSSPFFVVTVNPEIIIQSIIDNKFKYILRSSSINTADGVGIRWAINYLYGKRVERITGSDSLEKICGICADCYSSVFFFGAMPAIADKAAQILQQRIPDLKVEGTYSPSRTDILVEDLPAEIQYKLKNASVIFVALGAPDQEKWIHDNLPFLPGCKLIIGVGGSFDFIAGKIKRAPKLFRICGLEWLYRLIREPGRWRRMLKLPAFAITVMLIKLSEPRIE
jgi:N-acetylglucosaminyldiphosphoundecaprenol N-acetyl-beta-D-mannosaminyltransferase